MSDIDVEERELRMARLRADFDDKRADTAYKSALSWTEPYKLILGVVVATATVAGAIFGFLGFTLGRGH